MKEKDADLDKYDHSREELQKRLAQLERDMQMALTQEKQAHEDDVDRLMREKVSAFILVLCLYMYSNYVQEISTKLKQTPYVCTV